MKKDAAARVAILAALERQLKKGDKSLVGNKGYRRFLATPGDDRFAIDRAKAEEDAKFDGVFVLRTNADSPAAGRLPLRRVKILGESRVSCYICSLSERLSMTASAEAIPQCHAGVRGHEGWQFRNPLPYCSNP